MAYVPGSTLESQNMEINSRLMTKAYKMKIDIWGTFE